MKCSGKLDTTWNTPRIITYSTLHFMLYRGKLIFFGTMWRYVAGLGFASAISHIHQSIHIYQSKADKGNNNIYKYFDWRLSLLLTLAVAPIRGGSGCYCCCFAVGWWWLFIFVIYTTANTEQLLYASWQILVYFYHIGFVT